MVLLTAQPFNQGDFDNSLKGASPFDVSIYILIMCKKNTNWSNGYKLTGAIWFYFKYKAIKRNGRNITLN